ncbi:hypothetical protein LOK49_LG12G00838 [Camellia lanceoleosa]|uniref:Uncharacterized protein n=1 Tax=Camellia lanceoleosa TaxID=1840588 RepID=A0ACC0FPQ8_9ERIC|nr:hypothetical protein LOK49_LG12G00838 [Camellia lanceoleosa]
MCDVHTFFPWIIFIKRRRSFSPKLVCCKSTIALSLSLSQKSLSLLSAPPEGSPTTPLLTISRRRLLSSPPLSGRLSPPPSSSPPF